jgi:hypothetical protein
MELPSAAQAKKNSNEGYAPHSFMLPILSPALVVQNRKSPSRLHLGKTSGDGRRSCIDRQSCIVDEVQISDDRSTTESDKPYPKVKYSLSSVQPSKEHLRPDSPLANSCAS